MEIKESAVKGPDVSLITPHPEAFGSLGQWKRVCSGPFREKKDAAVRTWSSGNREGRSL